MPEPLHPTYLPTALTPRQIDKWLDVNSQNGPLTRTRGNFSIPIFDIETDWEGFSDVVGEYNYIASANFGLRSLINSFPAIPNYVATIMYVNSDNTVIRYIIAGDTSSGIFYTTIPAYNGEMIKTKFKIEIWSINANNATQATNILLETTVLGSQDYRFGVDFSLANPSALCTSVKSITGAFPTEPDQSQISVWLSSDTGITITGGKVSNWVDRVSEISFDQATAGQRPLFFDQGSQGKWVQFLDNQLLQTAVGSVIPICQTLWFAVVQSIGGAAAHRIYEIDDAPAVNVSSDDGSLSGKPVLFVDPTFVSSFKATDGLIIIKVDTFAESITIYDLDSGLVKGTNTSGLSGPALAPNNIILGDQFSGIVGKGFAIIGFVAYGGIQSDEQEQNTLDYLLGLFPQNTTLPLPMQFYPCAQPNLN